MLKLKKIKKYINYWEYYLEQYIKFKTGRGVLDSYKNGEYNLLNKIIKDKQDIVIIDIGANIGEYSKVVLTLSKSEKLKLFSIEADPRNFSKLCRNIIDKRIVFINCAITAKSGDIELFIRGKQDEYPGSNSLYKQYEFSGRSINVKGKTVIDIQKEFQIKHINLIKIDIEGAEIDAIIGMNKILEEKTVDFIQLEYNQTWILANHSLKKLFDIANKYNYSIYRIAVNRLIPLEKYNPLLDDFNYQNILLVSPNCRLPIKLGRKPLPF